MVRLWISDIIIMQDDIIRHPVEVSFLGCLCQQWSSARLGPPAAGRMFASVCARVLTSIRLVQHTGTVSTVLMQDEKSECSVTHAPYAYTYIPRYYTAYHNGFRGGRSENSQDRVSELTQWLVLLEVAMSVTRQHSNLSGETTRPHEWLALCFISCC